MTITDYLPFSVYNVSGHSMEPAISSGSKILIWQWAYLFRQPRVGDIILFRKGEEYWVKRIKAINQAGVEVEGDNKIDSKEIGLVKKKDILGKVIIS